jgi:hypothetical protein
MKLFISNTKYLFAGCSPWNFLAEREVACDYISINISDAGDKHSMTINISRLVNLKGEFPAEIAFTVSSATLLLASWTFSKVHTDEVTNFACFLFCCIK